MPFVFLPLYLFASLWLFEFDFPPESHNEIQSKYEVALASFILPRNGFRVIKNKYRQREGGYTFILSQRWYLSRLLRKYEIF